MLTQSCTHVYLQFKSIFQVAHNLFTITIDLGPEHASKQILNVDNRQLRWQVQSQVGSS
jgi:hypothetical protein